MPIRYHDGVPHIDVYGMYSQEEEKCWITFWREGRCFTVFVDGADVRGTPFYEKWLPLIREWSEDELGSLEEYMRVVMSQSETRWTSIVSQSIDVTSELAPVQPHWATFHDYLHSPTYELRLRRDDKTGDAKAHVIKGPEDKPAFDCEPTRPEELGPLPQDIPRYNSTDILLLAHGFGLGPVRTADGKTFDLKPVEPTAVSADTDEERNESLDILRIQTKLYERMWASGKPVPSNIQRLVGIVTDAPPTAAEASSNQQSLVAGFLLTGIPGGRPLSDILNTADPGLKENIYTKSLTWKSQMRSAIEAINDMGEYCGWTESNDWYMVNQYTIIIDEKDNAWLKIVQAGEGTGDATVDLKGLERVFGEWLPKELKRLDKKDAST